MTKAEMIEKIAKDADIGYCGLSHHHQEDRIHQQPMHLRSLTSNLHLHRT